MKTNALLFDDLAADPPKIWFLVLRLCLAAVFLYDGAAIEGEREIVLDTDHRGEVLLFGLA